MGIFYFNNPDLNAYNQAHCFVEPNSMVPVKIGVTPSDMAIDVTFTFLNLFKWGFIICMIGLSSIFSVILAMCGAAAGKPIFTTLAGIGSCCGLCVYTLAMSAFTISVWIIRY